MRPVACAFLLTTVPVFSARGLVPLVSQTRRSAPALCRSHHPRAESPGGEPRRAGLFWTPNPILFRRWSSSSRGEKPKLAGVSRTTSCGASVVRGVATHTAFPRKWGGVLRGGATATRRFSAPSAAALWGVAGVVAMLLNAVKRVLPVALEPFRVGLSPGLWVAYGAFAVGMGYAEGWKSFHRKFSPLVVSRAMTLTPSPNTSPHPLVHTLLAPLYAMGLFHATPRRVATSWGFLVGVYGLVKLVKQLSYPWRSIVDAGVVVGLTIGSASILWHYAREVCAGIPAPADPSLPPSQTPPAQQESPAP